MPSTLCADPHGEIRQDRPCRRALGYEETKDVVNDRIFPQDATARLRLLSTGLRRRLLSLAADRLSTTNAGTFMMC